MMILGMPIYNANHYYGIFSGVNTAYIDSVNIFKNTYPLQYGGKTAGLVELFSSNTQPAETKGNINIDFLTASSDVVIPISKNSFVSVAARSTIKEMVMSSLSIYFEVQMKSKITIQSVLKTKITTKSISM